MFFLGIPSEDDGQDHRECTHEEPNGVRQCVQCGGFTLLVRDTTRLLHGETVAYDPFCGYTVSMNVT